MKARTLDRANVNKYVRPTVVRLNKAKAFLAVEPLHNACSHFPSPCWLKRLLPTQPVSKFDPAMSWRKSRAGRGHQGSQIARTPSLYPFWTKTDTRKMQEHPTLRRALKSADIAKVVRHRIES